MNKKYRGAFHTSRYHFLQFYFQSLGKYCPIYLSPTINGSAVHTLQRMIFVIFTLSLITSTIREPIRTAPSSPTNIPANDNGYLIGYLLILSKAMIPAHSAKLDSVSAMKKPSGRQSKSGLLLTSLRQHRTTPVHQYAQPQLALRHRFSSDCLNSTQACKRSSLRFTQRQGEFW